MWQILILLETIYNTSRHLIEKKATDAVKYIFSVLGKDSIDNYQYFDYNRNTKVGFKFHEINYKIFKFVIFQIQPRISISFLV